MSIFTKLTSDANGNMLVNDKVATREQVRAVLESGGSWNGGEFITCELGSETVTLQPANDAARDVVNGMRQKRGLFGR